MIPLHVPDLGPDDWEAARTALEAGHIVGNGPVSARAQAFIEQALPVRHTLVTTSCTHAMELAMLAIGLGPGDEVICPSFTHPSTANAAALRGATPVFADVDPDTLSLDPDDVAAKITRRTRAVIPVHYAGAVAGMEELTVLAAARGLRVVEDAAQAWGTYYDGRAAGALGTAGCFSFHATKNVTCGEGGAFVTEDDELFRAAEVISEKGTNRNAFVRGEVDRYTWVSLGSSYVLSDLLAAVLLSQLQKSTRFVAARGALVSRYVKAMRCLELRELIRLPVISPECAWNYHTFFIRLARPAARDAVIARLRGASVGAAIHFVPLHTSPLGRLLQDDDPSALPHTEEAAASIVRLPLYAGLPYEDQDRVIDAVLDVVPRVIASVSEAEQQCPPSW